MAELLVDQRVQFDVIEADADFHRYRLIVVPDGLDVSVGLAQRLTDYVHHGGAILAFGSSAMVAGEAETWLPMLDIELHGRSPFTPAYLLPGDELSRLLPYFEYALYNGTWEWTIPNGKATDTVLAWVGVPAFQRSPEHYTSHAQSPYSHATSFVAVAHNGPVAAASFDLGSAYYSTGYWPYRLIFASLLDRVLPRRLIRSSAPGSAEISITQQVVDGRQRWLVHIVNYSTGRRWGPRLERFEDSIPISNVVVCVDVASSIDRAWNAETGESYTVRQLGSAQDCDDASARLVEIVVPLVDTNCLVVLESSTTAKDT